MSAQAVSLSRPRLIARGSIAVSSSASTGGMRRPAAVAGVEVGRTERARATRLNLVAGVIVLSAMLLHVWTGLKVGTLGYELSHARDLGQRLDRQLNELTLEHSSMMKPDVLAEEARRRLGLDWPQSGQIVALR
jgi:cell division protein FtsL